MWLDDLNIAVREHPIRLPNRRKPVLADGYDPKTNTVYEFLGDYFHGNPAVYDPEDWDSRSRRCTYGQQMNIACVSSMGFVLPDTTS